MNAYAVSPSTSSTRKVERIRVALNRYVVGEELRSQWVRLRDSGASVHAVEVERVHSHKKNHCVVQYCVEVKKGCRIETYFLIGELSNEDPMRDVSRVHQALKKKRRGAISGRDLNDNVFVLPSLGVLIREWGFDERLPGLRLVHDLDYRHAILSPCLGTLPRGDIDDIRILAHRLGKRCVVAVKPMTGTALIVKMYKARDRRAQLTYQQQSELFAKWGHGTGPLSIPRPVAFLSPQQMSVTEAISADALDTLEPNAIDNVERAGRALAALHQSTVALHVEHDSSAEIALLHRMLTLPKLVQPSLAFELKAAERQVLEQLTHCARSVRRTGHRDFHEKQVLLGREQTYIIDFDTMAWVDPALDIGNFLAHVRFASVVNDTDLSHLEVAFLRAYRSEGNDKADSDDTVVNAYLDATLLRLAAIYSLSTKHLQHVPRLLDFVR